MPETSTPATDAFLIDLRKRQAARTGFLLSSDGTDPDRAAEAERVGGALGLPGNVVLPDLETFRAQADSKRTSTILANAPATAAWLSDLRNGTLAKDDVENLSWFENGLKNYAIIGAPAWNAGERGVRRIGAAPDTARGFGAANTLEDVGRSYGDIYAEEIAALGGNEAVLPPQILQTAKLRAQTRYEATRGMSEAQVVALIESGAAALQASRQKFDKIAELSFSAPATRFRDEGLSAADNSIMGVLGAFANDPVGAAAFIAETAGEFLPAMLVASAVTAVTRSPAAGSMTMGGASFTTESTASAMDFLAERGADISTPEAAAAVLQDADLMAAARERGLTRGVIIGLMDAISGGVAGVALSKSPIGDILAQGIAQVGFGSAGEGFAQLAAGQDINWADIVIEGLAELATAPIEVLGVGGRKLFGDSARMARAGKSAETLAAIDERANTSKLRERSPERFQELLDQNGAGNAMLYVSAEGLQQYYQAKDMALDDETLRAWGIEPETFRWKVDSGGDVAIPASNYATRIAGTDDAAWFRDNGVFNPNEAPLTESAEFNDRVRGIIEKAMAEEQRAREIEASNREIGVKMFDHLQSQLRAAGKSTDTATYNVMPLVAFGQTMIERAGISPESALAMIERIVIRGPASETSRRRGNLDLQINTLRARGAKALAPRGPSLAEFVRSRGGIQDRGGDIEAMDAPKGVIAERAREYEDRRRQPTLGGLPAQGRGVMLDEMGRMAAEAGYFPDLIGEALQDGTAPDYAARLLAALGEDIAGRKVYAMGEGPDADMQALSDAIAKAGLDITTATNDEIAAALEAPQDGRQYDQSDDAAFAAEVMAELAQVDELFQNPTAQAGTIEGVFAEVDPSIEYLGPLSQDDPRFEDKKGDPETVTMLRTTERPGKEPHDFYVMETRDEVWIDVSELVQGEGGSAIYAAIADYAFNTGKVFIGDPGGLSLKALRRRTDAMLSSALKHGTTRHLAPHERQIEGMEKQGVPPLKWTPGDDPASIAANIRSLIEVSTANLLSIVPEAADARYDFSSGTFRNAEGQRLSDEVLEGWASDVRGMRTTRTGGRSVKRGILLNTLARAESGQRSGLLEQSLRQPGKLVTKGGLAGTFYQPDGSGPRGSITFPKDGVLSGETVINLFGSANLSTFLHESSHFFLEAFTALASDANAPQQMRDDLATIRAWLGNDGGSLSVDQHEKFARGGEAYFMEGQAPSLALADAFSRFKAWLTRIYRTIAGLNVKITPEIREVMDRMLATDAEIAAARAQAEMRPLFAEAPAGMSEATFNTYRRMAQRGQEQAEAALLKSTMEKVRREQESWFRAERKAVLAEVSNEINKQPVYRLTEMLANQTWIGSEEAVPDMRMDRQALVEMFGEGVLAELSRARLGGKRAVYAEGGESLYVVADFFGFEGPVQMVEALQNAPKRNDAIKVEVERRLTERHGDPLSDGTIEELALEAIHSEQAVAAQVVEARTIARRAGVDTRNIKAKAYQARAREMIGQMSAREVLRPDSFLAAERKAARDAENAFAKVTQGGRSSEQNLALALKAKERQIINGFLYMEAKQFTAEFGKARERMMAYDKKSVREKLEGGYIEQIDALRSRFDFRVRSQKAVARAESLRAYVDRMIADGREAELNIDERLMDEARKVHYSRLSVDELRGLFDTIENIDHMGRFKQKLIDAKRRRDLAETASRVAGQVRKASGDRVREQSGFLKNAFNLAMTADTMFAALDQGDEMGPVYDALKADIDRGQAEEQRMSVAMATDLDGLFRKHYSAADIAAMKKEKAIPGANGRPWAKLEILAVALNTGNADGFQRLTDQRAHEKNRLTPQQVDALLGEMTRADWEFVQSVWTMVNGYWGQLSEVAKRRTGVSPAKVEAAMQVPAPAFVTGGYYPIKYDPTLSQAAAQDEASAWDKFLTSGHGATAAIRNGMTKQRQKNGGGRTLLLEPSVMISHMRDTIRYIALSEAVDNSYKVLNHPEVRQAFLDTGRDNEWKTLQLWLKDTARGPVFNTDALNTFARIVKNNFTLSRLAFNLKTVALQVTGLGQSAVVIGKKNMAKGMLDYLKRPAVVTEIIEKSSFMSERKSSFQKDIYDMANDTKLSSPLASRWHKGKNWISKLGFAPMVATQFYVVDVPTWLGAYNDGVLKYGTEEKAIAYADRMVARAQGSGLYADRAAFERGTISEGTRQADFIRLWTTLGSYMLTKMNRGYLVGVKAGQAMSEADTTAQKAGVALKAAGDLALLYMFEAALMAMLYAMMDDDDEPEDIIKFILTETGGATVGGMPIVRDIVSGFRGYGAGGVYGSVLEIPSDLFRQIEQGDIDRGFRRAVGDTFGLLTGLPSTATLRAVEAAMDPKASVAEGIFGSNPLTR